MSMRLLCKFFDNTFLLEELPLQLVYFTLKSTDSSRLKEQDQIWGESQSALRKKVTSESVAGVARAVQQCIMPD
jgi:hypothetical protein